MNNHAELNPQDETTSFARMTTEELAEYDAYLDSVVGMGNDVSEYADEPEQDSEPMGSHDLSDDAEALASAGHGMDEDYAPDAHLEAFYEERTDIDFMGD